MNPSWIVLALASFVLTLPIRSSSSIDDLAFMSGCWEMNDANGTVEEHWMTPRGGTMLGMSRTVRAGRAVAHEALRIEEEGDDLVYHAAPSGQSPAAFRATSVETGAVVFENATHDFPQRIRYLGARDSLHASVEGNLNGRQRSIKFAYGRVPCPGGS